MSDRLNTLELAEAFSRHANSFSSEPDVFADAVLKDHRTLIQRKFVYMMKCIEKFAQLPDVWTDARNAETHKIAKAMWKGFVDMRVKELADTYTEEEAREFVNKHGVWAPCI